MKLTEITFSDRPDFRPSYTPVEMFELGIFGGGYFQLETELPQQFVKDMGENWPQSSPFLKTRNCFGVKSGSTLEWWTEQKLIHPDDPNGWVEWYVKFYYGRRHPDDSRQIKRFRAFAVRHTAMLRGYQLKGKDSLKTKQNLLQWAWSHREDPTW